MFKKVLYPVFLFFLTTCVFAQVSITDSDFNPLIGKYSPAKNQFGITTKGNLTGTFQVQKLQDIFHIKNKPEDTTIIASRQLDLVVQLLETGKTAKINSNIFRRSGISIGLEFVRSPSQFYPSHKKTDELTYTFFSVGLSGQIVRRKLKKNQEDQNITRNLFSGEIHGGVTYLQKKENPNLSITFMTAVRYGSNYQNLPSFITKSSTYTDIEVSDEFEGLFGQEKNTTSIHPALTINGFINRFSPSIYVSNIISNQSKPSPRLGLLMSILDKSIKLEKTYKTPSAIGIGWEMSPNKKPVYFISGSITINK